MKKCISLICVLLLVVCVFPVTAAAGQQETQNVVSNLNEDGLLERAPIQISQDGNGTYEISLTQVKPLDDSIVSMQVSPADFAGEQRFTTSSVKFIAFSEEEADAIVEELNTLRAAGGTIDDDRSLLGNSCHIYINLNFSTTYGAMGKLYRIDKVTVSYNTNSGTTIPWKSLNLSCMSVGADNKNVTYVKSYSPPSNPYTTYEMSNLKYVYNTGPSLGAAFEVTAKRSSGESVTSSVSASVFQN